MSFAYIVLLYEVLKKAKSYCFYD